MKLYGSLTSVYVRRIRMALDGFDYEMKVINVYDDKERAEFTKISPIRRMPVLVDGDNTIWDSHVIERHLSQKRGDADMSVEQLNLISAIDAATDSMIILFQSQSSGLETPPDKLFYKLQYERVTETLTWLEQQAENGVFDEWHYPAIAMVCTVDWAQFRGINDFAQYPALIEVQQRFAHLAIVKATEPSL